VGEICHHRHCVAAATAPAAPAAPAVAPCSSRCEPRSQRTVHLDRLGRQAAAILQQAAQVVRLERGEPGDGGLQLVLERHGGELCCLLGAEVAIGPWKRACFWAGTKKSKGKDAAAGTGLRGRRP